MLLERWPVYHFFKDDHNLDFQSVPRFRFQALFRDLEAGISHYMTTMSTLKESQFILNFDIGQ